MATVDGNLEVLGSLVNALLDPRAADPGSPAAGQVWYNTTDGRLRYFDGAVKTFANLADLTGGAITGALWDAQSYIKAVIDDTPVVQVVNASEVVGRRAAGDLGVISYANLVTDLVAIGIDAATLQGSSLATVLARGNHTGTQTASTISDFAAEVQVLIDAVIDAAPGALDTLNELAAALGDDPNFAATINASLAARVQQATVNFGDAAATSFVVLHSLGTTNVNVQVWNNSTNQLVIMDTVTTTNANNVTITTNSVPALDAYRAVIQGL